MIKITSLFCYPVKSLAGISLDTAKLDSFGIEHDRRWVVVDAKGKFITQRTHPQMALIHPNFVEGLLVLSFQEQTVTVPKANKQSAEMEVTVWKDTVRAKHLCSDVDKALSQWIGQKCHLIYMNPEVQRQIDLDYAPKEHFVSFADAFPFLLTNQSSLDDLNQHLKQKAEMIRFRPNIVVDGVQAYAEDSFKEFQINKLELLGVKKCSRCPLPTVNPQKGIKDNPQILTVLNRLRKENSKVYFGQNLIYKNPENAKYFTLSIGDEIILK